MKIEIEHVSKKIKDALVLDDVCMTLESGNIYGFQGVNGSGKTMLMRAVSGLMYPTSGTISIDGKVLGKNMAFPEKIGMLIENPAFIDSYTGYDNLKMLASINKGEVDISRALETVGLNPQDKRKYRKYSLGMKQRRVLPVPLWRNQSFFCWMNLLMLWTKRDRKNCQKS